MPTAFPLATAKTYQDGWRQSVTAAVQPSEAARHAAAQRAAAAARMFSFNG